MASVTTFLVTLINVARRTFDESSVHLLLSLKPTDVDLADLRDEHGLNLLHIAVQYTNVGLVKFLIENDCDVNGLDRGGNNCLIYALWCSSTIEVVRLLIESGADIHAKNVEGLSPFGHAAANPYVVTSRLVLAAAAGVQINATNLADILRNANWTLHQVIELRDVELTRCMIQRGANVNSRSLDVKAETPLHRAARIGDPDQVDLLLLYGADPLATARHVIRVWTPLLDAVTSRADGAARCAVLLLTHGDLRDPNVTSGEALRLAAYYCNAESVQVLLSYEVIVNRAALYTSATLKSALKSAFFNPPRLLCNTDVVWVPIEDKKRTLHLLLEHGAYAAEVGVLNNATVLFENEYSYPAIKVVLEHVARLDFMGKNVMSLLGEEDVERIKTVGKLKAYYDKCELELIKLRDTQVFGRVRLSHLLIDNADKMVKYAKIKSLVNVLATELMTIEFPIYAEALVSRFNEAKKTRVLLDEAIETLSWILPLPHKLLEQIISYLDLADLHLLV